jgi:OHCU decarboxylase
MSRYPRDMVGYAGKPPHARWPHDARIAVQFVINYEEGGENNILHGDAASEAFLSEIVGAQAWPGQRHMNMESIYEYGSRAGFWRLHDLFTSRNMPVTVFGVATAMARNPDAVAAMRAADWEIASHGLKWIDYKDYSAEDERTHIDEAVRLHTEVTGERPLGMYQGRTSINTIPQTIAEGGFVYSADVYADELPYWSQDEAHQFLMVPYTLDANDMRFATPQGFNSGDQFFSYLKDSFDVLYREGSSAPKMLSIGLHCRLVGRPGRAAALERFLDYVRQHEQVWVARRIDIARHWIKTHPPKGGFKPSLMPRALFTEAFGDIYEHTPQVAERAHAQGLTSAHNTASGLHERMVEVMRAMSKPEKLALIKAHPDLAGRLALAKQLTADSNNEQSSVGLDRLTPAELERFTTLNDTYRARFGFPFIFAVKGRTKDEIIASFETRIHHSQEAEFDEALRQIERIGLLRLKDRLPD